MSLGNSIQLSQSSYKLQFTLYMFIIYNIRETIVFTRKKRGGIFMSNMYKVMAFWTGIFAVMFYLGHMPEVSLLFVGNTGLFLLLGFLNLSERMYMYIFGAYLTIFFAGFTYYTTFLHVPGGH